MQVHDNNTISKNKSVLFLVILFLGIIFAVSNVSQNQSVKNLQANLQDSFTFSHSLFEKIILEADVAYVLNLEHGTVLYQKNAEEIRPLASLTKIMTAYSALLIFPENATVTIAASDLEPEGDHGLIPGEIWNLQDLLVFMLVSSSNDAAKVIEREALSYIDGISFVDYMTQTAKDLGLDSLQFQNASGLDLDKEGSIPGAVGTAEDITKLFSIAYEQYQDIFNQTKKQKITLHSSEKQHTAENTNTALDILPGVTSSKTGYTNTARGNLSVVVEINSISHIVTVFNSTRQGRFEDVGKIIGTTEEENK